MLVSKAKDFKSLYSFFDPPENVVGFDKGRKLSGDFEVSAGHLYVAPLQAPSFSFGR